MFNEALNKSAIVTGSGRGIGKATALRLAKEGYNIVVTARTGKEIQQVVTEIEKLGVKSLAIKADVGKSPDVENLVKQTIKNFGRIDVLVNNAGILVVKSLVDTTEEEWDTVIDTNLRGIFLCSKAVLRYMIKQKSGAIINISSGAGKSGYANFSAYCASKFGAIGLTESLAGEVSRYGIKIVAICPGPVKTKMQEIVSGTRIGQEPEEIAEFIWNAIQGKYPNGSAIDTY